MLRTASRLAAAGHEVDIYTMSWDGEAPPEGVHVHIVRAQGWFNFQKYQDFIVNAQRQLAAEAKHVLIVGWNRMTGLDVYFAADPCFIERAHQQRNWLYRLTPRYRWFQQVEAAIFAPTAATEMLMVDMSEKLVFQRWYQTQDAKFHHIPPFLSAERLKLHDRAAMRQHLRQAFDLPPDSIVMLLVGSGFYMKGLDRAIKALASLPQSMRQRLTLIAIGQDKPAPFLRMARQLGVSEQVLISKGRPDIPQLMQGADLYLHPAYRENTGLVLLEALASGLPVLATASCGYALHIEAADAGRVVPSPFEQTALNQTLLQMLTLIRGNDAQLTRWREQGLAYARALMEANDGGAEAEILQRLAQRKEGA